MNLLILALGGTFAIRLLAGRVRVQRRPIENVAWPEREAGPADVGATDEALLVHHDAVFGARLMKHRGAVPEDDVCVLDALIIAVGRQFFVSDFSGIGLGHPEIVLRVFFLGAEVT